MKFQFFSVFLFCVHAQNGEWTNWSQKHTGTYLSYNIVTSEQEIIDVVNQAVEMNETVSVVGAGHSFAPLVPIQGEQAGHMIDLSEMNNFVRFGENNVTVQGGMTVGQLVLLLTQNNLALPNNGGPQINTVAGTVNTNTHGTGTTEGLSGFVRGVRVVTGTGDVLQVDERTPTILPAFMEAVGVLGIFTEVTLQTVPLFQIRQFRTREVTPYQYVELFPELRTDFIDLFTFYWEKLDTATLTTYQPTFDAPTPGGCTVACNLTSCVDYGNQCLGGCDGVIPPLSNMECFVPAEVGQEFVMEWIKKLEELETYFPQLVQSSSGARFIRADGIFMSPMYEQDSMSLDWAWQSESPEIDQIFQDAFVDHCWSYRARMHWGKESFYTPEQTRSLYPRFDDFLAIRRTLDPTGVFLKNEFVRSMFE